MEKANQSGKACEGSERERGRESDKMDMMTDLLFFRKTLSKDLNKKKRANARMATTNIDLPMVYLVSSDSFSYTLSSRIIDRNS